MLVAIGSLTALGVVLGAVLGVSARLLRVEGDPLVNELEEMLPGTNCGQCGLPGCSAAAAALANGEAQPTLCPPGGKGVAQQIAERIGVPLDLSALADTGPILAVINEAECTGCMRCFKRCPTDAIFGAKEQIHVVIADACNGCAKCVDVCPLGGVDLVPVPITLANWNWPRPTAALASVDEPLTGPAALKRPAPRIADLATDMVLSEQADASQPAMAETV